MDTEHLLREECVQFHLGRSELKSTGKAVKCKKILEEDVEMILNNRVNILDGAYKLKKVNDKKEYT